MAHPDDETLGCGGTLVRAMEKGSTVDIVIPVRRIEDECYEAIKTLGVTSISFGDFRDNEMDDYPLMTVSKFFENYVELFNPDLIFTHYPDCTNQDHRVCYEAAIIATRKRNVELLGCEILSSTGYLKPVRFEPNIFIELNERHMKTKCEAMKKYVSEFQNGRSAEKLEALAKYRGIFSNGQYAEAFMLFKGIV